MADRPRAHTATLLSHYTPGYFINTHTRIHDTHVHTDQSARAGTAHPASREGVHKQATMAAGGAAGAAVAAVLTTTVAAVLVAVLTTTVSGQDDPMPAPAPAACARRPVVFAFGDSNTDTGGVAAGLGHYYPLPEGRVFFRRSTGRLCDGRLVIDYLCECPC